MAGAQKVATSQDVDHKAICKGEKKKRYTVRRMKS